MRSQFLRWGLVGLVLWAAGCVSKENYRALEQQSGHTRQHAEELQAQLAECQRENQQWLEDFTDLERMHGELQLRRQSDSVEKDQLRQQIAAGDAALQACQEENNTFQAEVRAQERVKEKNQDLMKRLQTVLTSLAGPHEVTLRVAEDALIITLQDRSLFQTGSDVIHPNGQTVLKQIAALMIDQVDQHIDVSCHTDNMPINPRLKSRFPTGWEFSAARAVAVARFLQEKGSLEPQRLSATGHSYFRPVTGNDTPEGRQQNRRIEILLTSGR